MSPENFKRIREGLGFTQEAWGRALGYSGPHVRGQVHRMEAGERPIGPTISRLVEMYGRHGVPDDWILQGDDSDVDISVVISRLERQAAKNKVR